MIRFDRIKILRKRIKILEKRIAQLEGEKIREEYDHAKRETEAKGIIKSILGYDPSDGTADGPVSSLNRPVQFTEEEAEAISNLIDGGYDC